MPLPNITDAVEYGLPLKDFDFVADPETDLSATFYENMAVDVAALSFTAPRAIAQVDSSGALVGHSAMWGNTDQVKPTVTYVSEGRYTITWASSYTDLNPTPDRRVTRPIQFRFATAQLLNLNSARLAPAISWTGNSVTVQWYEPTGSPNDTDFIVFAY